MPRIYDRTTGTTLGWLSKEELDELFALLQKQPVDIEEPYLIEPEAIDRLESAGASERLLLLVRQILEGRETLDLGWDEGEQPA